MSAKIRIIVAEDHVIARVGVTAIITTQPDMKVIAEATNGQEALDQYEKHLPDVILLDMRLPKMSGVEAAVAIRAAHPDARIIALTSYGAAEDVRRALNAGVQAYLTKDVLNEELLSTIRVVHGGQTYLPPALAATLESQAAAKALSAREIDVLRLIVQGLSNKQIAFELDIAEGTTKNHVQSVLTKLGVQDRTQAATVAIKRGIVNL